MRRFNGHKGLVQKHLRFNHIKSNRVYNNQRISIPTFRRNLVREELPHLEAYDHFVASYVNPNVSFEIFEIDPSYLLDLHGEILVIILDF
jgi:hypothetical protein